MPAPGTSHLVEERLRLGYRYLRWGAWYRPLLGASTAMPTPTPHGENTLERITRPLAAAGTTAAERARIRDHCAARLDPVVVTLCAGRLPASAREQAAALRAVAELAPGPQVVLELVRAPRNGPGHGALPEAQARFEAALEAFATAVRGVAGPQVRLTASQDTADTAAGPQPRFFYRAVDFPLVELRRARSPAVALTGALLGLMHDRPGLAVCGDPVAAACALAAGHAAVLGASGCDLRRLRGWLATTPAEWTDPAQEPVAIVLPEPPAAAAARRTLRSVTGLVALLHGRLRLSARVASESDPLAVDKQQLIVVACPELLSPQGTALLLRQIQRGRSVVAWAGPAVGPLARAACWTRDPGVLIRCARAAGLGTSARQHDASTLHRWLGFGRGALAAQLHHRGCRLRWHTTSATALAPPPTRP